MQLIDINKKRYRRHLNYIIVACVISLTTGCLAISQLLIALFPDASGSHFHWNLTGVVVTSLLIGLTLNKYRTHDFMTEVSYIWDLKQVLNRINRKMRKLKAAAEDGNINALLAIHYSYAGSRLLWQLDDNLIIMDQLAIDQAEIDCLAATYNVTLTTESYDEGVLREF
ncbi:MAG: hypothetical protein ACI9IT_000198 [Glaciecola sp.]|jgi:hypothetical protein